MFEPLPIAASIESILPSWSEADANNSTSLAANEELNAVYPVVEEIVT